MEYTDSRYTGPAANAVVTGSEETKGDSVVSENLRCRYSNKKCVNPRAEKRVGGLHTFCKEHRDNANRNQRRLDKKKRVERRQQESIQAYYDTVRAEQQLKAQQMAAAPPPPPLPPRPSSELGLRHIPEPFAKPTPLLQEDVSLLVEFLARDDPYDSDYDSDAFDD